MAVPGASPVPAPAPGLPGARLLAAVDRLLACPARFVTAMLMVTVAGLALDRVADLGWQTMLGLATWLILLAACRTLAPERRAEVAVVVVVATICEVIGSIIWGVYEYRLGNLPLFVPPGHGLVYLTGLALSRTGLVSRHPRAFVGAALTAALTWALLGITVLPAADHAGAFGVLVVCLFIVRGRAPTVYAGVFFAVAFLELYGTAMGTWRWATEIPGLGVADGNPPSGAAAGYVMFDILALTLAPRLLAAARRLRARLGRRRCRRSIRRSVGDSSRRPAESRHALDLTGLRRAGDHRGASGTDRNSPAAAH